jgi:hypothetical protein
MAETRNTRLLVRKKLLSGGPLPTNALMGEPFINLYDGILKFSGVTGGAFTASAEAGVFEVGSKLYNQFISNEFNVNDEFKIGSAGTITKYAGTTSFVGKFLSGTTAGFVLADIASIQSEAAGETGEVQFNNGDAFGSSSAFTFNNVTNTLFAKNLTSDAITGGTLQLTGVASYNGDLSGSYTDRSLVDKGFVVNGLTTLESSLNTTINGLSTTLNTRIDNVEASLTAETAARISADNTLQSAITAEENARISGDNALNSALSTETAARIAADLVLQGNIDAETASRIAGDATLTSALSAETAARIAGDNALSSALSAETALRISADAVLTTNLALEVTRATDAEAVLQDNINAEAALRIAGDAATLTSANAYTNTEILALIDGASSGYDTLGKLEEKISFIISNIDPAELDSLTEIVEALQNLEGDATAALNALATDLQAAIDAEIARAEDAEAALQFAINTEEAARIAADTALSQSLSQEILRAQAAETVLTNNLAAEVTRAEAAEGVLRDDLNTEIANRIAGDAALQSALTSEINRAISAENQLAIAITNEETARIAADLVLQGNIDAETAARISGDATLTSALSAETAARIAGDNALNSALTAETASRIAGDNALQANIDNVEASLTSALSAETAARIAGDAALTSALSAETAARIAGDDALNSALSTETADRIAADLVLQGNIDDATTDLSNNYYDKTASDSRFVNVSGDTMSGALVAAGLTATDLTAGRAVFVGTDGKLVDSSEFTFASGLLTAKDITTAPAGTMVVGTGGLTVGSGGAMGTPGQGNLVVHGDLVVFGEKVEAFASQLYIEDNNITLNYNPSGDTSLGSIGAGFEVQDGLGTEGSTAFFRVAGTMTGAEARSFSTNLNDLRIRETGTAASPNGVRVLAETDILDGGSY